MGAVGWVASRSVRMSGVAMLLPITALAFACPRARCASRAEDDNGLGRAYSRSLRAGLAGGWQGDGAQVAGPQGVGPLP
jgi:hypothetical protein